MSCSMDGEVRDLVSFITMLRESLLSATGCKQRLAVLSRTDLAKTMAFQPLILSPNTFYSLIIQATRYTFIHR